MLLVYCLLVNRQRFLHDQVYHSRHQTVNLTRATLCEILASRVLRRFNEDNPTREGLLLLANVLVASFDPFQNCPEDIIRENRQLWNRQLQIRSGNHDRTSNALEVAILSESKQFLASTACQRVVESVYHGRIVYTPSSFIDIIPDHYKRRGISLYDPRKAPLLNQYRLIVPRTRNMLELMQFIILLFFYTMTMMSREGEGHIGAWEVVFLIYAFGWVLDEFASMLEHGWHVHTQNLWSFLDITFIAIYFIYLALRIYGWSSGNTEFGIQALDVLACAAPIVFPRIAFNVMPENMLFISLRAMMSDFIVLTALAVWCFGGFLLSMSWLSRWRSAMDEPIPPVTISKWMLWIWFGLDGTGVEQSVNFHLILGPVMMITFAFLGNTLFLTILVSMLTNTFSKIASDASAEIQFRRAVLTFEGVKSDAIFAYRPPFNILAVLILVPLRFVLTPRWFHKIHVTAARVLNAPLLIAIGLWERRRLWRKVKRMAQDGLNKSKSSLSLLNLQSFNAHRDLHDVFDLDPPQSMIDEIDEEDCIDDDFADVGINATTGPPRNRSVSPGIMGQVRRRRLSSTVPAF
jgi:hypothetical protein